jgi:predicted permease
MRALAYLRHLWLRLARRSRAQRSLEDEVRAYADLLAEEYERAGMPPAEARRRALVDLGGIEQVKEATRDVWVGEWVATVARDLRFTLRGLRTRPVFSAAVIATIALGIGANAAIFSAVDRLLFRAPPLLREPALTHRVYLAFPMPDGDGEFFMESESYSRYMQLTDWTSSLARTALASARDLAVGEPADARELPVGVVSASFFGFFDAPPVLGRYFDSSEDAPPNGTPVAVLSYATWQTRYRGSPGVLGATLRIGATVYTIIGVAPRAFAGLWPARPPVAYVPVSAVAAEGNARNYDGEAWWTSRTSSVGEMLAELKPGVTPAAATADLTAAAHRGWAGEGGPPALEPRAIVASVLTERGPNQTSLAKVAALVGGMALVVLLIACANVANLLLARALRRRREIAVRLALGASRRRLLSQLVTESMLLAALGGLAGLAVAQWGGSVLRAAFLPPGATSPVVTDTRTLVFVGVAVLVVGILTGLAPAWQSTRAGVTHDLRIAGREGPQRRSRARVTLLVMQGALSVMLLVAAGLFVRSLRNVQQLELGYDATRLLTADLNMRGVTLDSAAAVALRERLLTTAQGIPGVEHAALALALPLSHTMTGNIEIPDIDAATRQRLFEIHQTAVTPDYFATMGTRILRGRGIEAGDAAGAPGVIVVSRSMARLLWPGRDALGQCVKVRSLGRGRRGAALQCSHVVGIAEDIRNDRLNDAAGFVYYLSAAQFSPQLTRLVVRTRGDAARQAEAVRRVLQKEMPGVSYVTVTPYSAIVDEQARPWRLGVTMFVALGVLALALAAVGLYAVIAHDTEQRSREVGIRIALGARPEGVVWLVVRQGMLLAALGIAIGTGVTIAIAGRFAPLLFGVSPRDPLVYAVVVITMLAVAAAASFAPARRAARVDPNVALRSD